MPALPSRLAPMPEAKASVWYNHILRCASLPELFYEVWAAVAQSRAISSGITNLE
jgi:hypothetical protein